MVRFAVVDLSSLFYRSRHGAGDADEKIGMAVLIIFRSLRKMYRELKVDHIVFAVDQGSWRSAVYPAYKSRRRLERAQATPHEQEENETFYAALADLTKYLDQKTRCTVLQAKGIEGDDFVAGWIARHPNDEHIIISGDSDFVQLLAPNVRIYDAINQYMIATDKIVDGSGKVREFTVQKKDGKIKVGEINSEFQPEEEWWKKALFIKLIRGDVGDSVFSAFPGVRYDGAKDGKKPSIGSTWEDRKDKGYNWNNFMFQTWDKLVGTTPDGDKLTEKVRVIDEYRINEGLIDLTRQPADVLDRMNVAIDEAINRPLISNVGPYFLQFIKRHDIPSLEREAADHVLYLNAKYPKE